MCVHSSVGHVSDIELGNVSAFDSQDLREVMTTRAEAHSHIWQACPVKVINR